jgi:hypothetical protein
MIFSRITLFALYVFFVAAGTMWRFADAWGGLSLGRRIYLALSASWKWWLIFSVALLCRDSMTYLRLGVPGDIIVLAIAIVMSVVFAILRTAELRRSRPDQKK